jgi:hypothetical protein
MWKLGVIEFCRVYQNVLSLRLCPFAGIDNLTPVSSCVNEYSLIDTLCE